MTEKLLFCTHNQDACAQCKALTGLLFDPGTEPQLPIHDGCFSYYLDLDVDGDNFTLIHHHLYIQFLIDEIKQRVQNVQHVIDNLYDDLGDAGDT